MTTVVPFMDPTRPAQANPEYLAQAIDQFGVTNLFGSPALLKVLGRHARTRELTFPGLRRIISAGAAVPADTIALMSSAMSADARVHTPYGATECLPVTSISNVELTPEVLEKTRTGAGICVGKAVSPNQVAIMRIMDKAADDLHPEDLLKPFEVGEIVVHGPTTTDQYWQRDEQTRLAKTIDGSGRLWHRMGDIGYRDEQDRIWYCGRKSQRVETASGALFPDQVEAVFNAHRAVERSALVGIPGAGAEGRQRPVLCIERVKGQADPDNDTLIRELIAMAKEHANLAQIRHYLMHPGFPVDIRHNAKIGREQLGQWAAEQLP
jgi:acyl-CoA synthetase (AMP-forming)/AMP-acid ligase II